VPPPPPVATAPARAAAATAGAGTAAAATCAAARCSPGLDRFQGARCWLRDRYPASTSLRVVSSVLTGRVAAGVNLGRTPGRRAKCHPWLRPPLSRRRSNHPQ